MRKKSPLQVKKLLFALAIPQLAALIGSLFTMPAIGTWYQTLNKPSFTPPNWVFAPAWTTWFILMGIALYLVWTSKKSAQLKQDASCFFYMQLFFNCLWSILFFGFQNPLSAGIEIIFLWVLIFQTLLKFWHIRHLAGWLLVPYLAWVSFASILNFSIIWLN